MKRLSSSFIGLMAVLLSFVALAPSTVSALGCNDGTKTSTVHPVSSTGTDTNMRIVISRSVTTPTAGGGAYCSYNWSVTITNLKAIGRTSCSVVFDTYTYTCPTAGGSSSVFTPGHSGYTYLNFTEKYNSNRTTATYSTSLLSGTQKN